MSNESSSRRRGELRDLNWLGKTVVAGGALVRLTGTLIESTTDRVTSIAKRSKKAFNQGRNPNIEEARVLQETSAPNSASDDEEK